MKKIKIFLILNFSFLFSPGFSESDLPSLLFGYLKNDLTLQKYTLTAQDKALSYDASKIENGIELNLSTGTVKIQASSDGSKYTFTPSASLALPQLHDTTLSDNFNLS